MINFVTIGNVDAGKSTMIGSLLVATKSISERDIDKVKRQADEMKMGSWWLAYLVDTDDSERVRGKTHSFDMIPLEWKEKKLTMIDVPGHKDLVQEMIYGTSQADTAVLILSIRDGEYESGLSGQTLEHTIIARGMGIKTLIVAVNKMDTIEWNHEKYEKLTNDFRRKIKKYKFKTLEFVPISAYNQDNIIEQHPGFPGPLLDTIIEKHEPKQEDHLLNLNEKRVVLGRFIFCYVESVIAAGFTCKLHVRDQLLDCKLLKIRNDKLPFVTHANIENKQIDVVLHIVDEIKQIHSNLILRDGNKTIAIGKITKA